MNKKIIFNYYVQYCKNNHDAKCQVIRYRLLYARVSLDKLLRRIMYALEVLRL